MKKLIAMAVAFVLLLAVAVTAVGAVSLPPYVSSDWEDGPATQNGYLNPPKHQTVIEGNAGREGDDSRFYVEGVKGDKIPTIDGKVTEEEGYEDFLGYEDYLYLFAASAVYDKEEFYDWYQEVADMDLTVKTCWDGKYIYFYFEYAIKDFVYQPTNASNMWMYNCIQFGIANPKATGQNRSETGYAVNTLKQSFTATWAGGYAPLAGEDYVGKISNFEGSQTTKKLCHEFRVDLQAALGRDEPLTAGEQIKICWVIMANNSGNGSAGRCISFCRGLCDFAENGNGQKYAERFGTLTLGSGAEYDGEVNDKYYTPTEEDKDNGFHKNASLFFYDIEKTNDFKSDDGITAVYSEDQTYVTLFTEAAKSLYYSENRYPIGLFATDVGCAVIKYRTNSEGMQIGLNFKNTNMKPAEGETTVKFNPDYVVYPTEKSAIVADGEWHSAIFNVSSFPMWYDYITSMAIETSTGSVDIESVRFYAYDASEQYGFGEAASCVCQPDCDECTGDLETCPCQGTCDESGEECTEHTDADNDAKCDTCGATVEKKPDDQTSGTTEKPKEDGCKSVVATSASFVLAAAVAAGAIVIKKKEN